jgi:hypothetical protein
LRIAIATRSPLATFQLPASARASLVASVSSSAKVIRSVPVTTASVAP